MDLASNEHVIFEGHPSWRSILGFYFIGLVIALAAGGIALLISGTGIGIAAFGVVMVLLIIVGLIKRIGTVYTITNRRLHIRRGIIARKTQEANLQRVQNVNTNQGFLDRILQIGRVDFDTAGSGDFSFTFDGVAQPEKVVKAVERAQREFQANLAAEAQGMGPAGGTGL